MASEQNSKIEFKKILKLMLWSIFKPIINYPNQAQAIVGTIGSILTVCMIIGTFVMAYHTKRMANYTAQNVEYMLKNSGIFYLKLTLEITLDSTKVHPLFGIGNEKMPIFIGSEFKKYSQDFYFNIEVQNKSSVPIRNRFELYLLMKKYDDNEKEWIIVGSEYKLLSCERLNPEEKIKGDYRINKAIHDSGILAKNISDDSKIVLTLFVDFIGKEDYLNPKVELYPKLLFY